MYSEVIVVNYTVTVIVKSDYFRDYTRFHTSFDKAILCSFNLIPTWSEFINCISCIYYNYSIYYIELTWLQSPHKLHKLLLIIYFPNIQVNCKIMDLNWMLEHLFASDNGVFISIISLWYCCKGSQPATGSYDGYYS